MSKLSSTEPLKRKQLIKVKKTSKKGEESSSDYSVASDSSSDLGTITFIFSYLFIFSTLSSINKDSLFIKHLNYIKYLYLDFDDCHYNEKQKKEKELTTSLPIKRKQKHMPAAEEKESTGLFYLIEYTKNKKDEYSVVSESEITWTIGEENKSGIVRDKGKPFVATVLKMGEHLIIFLLLKNSIYLYILNFK